MQLKVNGEPFIFKHVCSDEEYGYPMSSQELHDFVTDSLIQAYAMKNVRCIRHDADFNSGADFSFTKYGKTISRKVICIDDIDEAAADIDRMYDDKDNYNPQMKRGFEEHGIIPRIYYADAHCIDSEDIRYMAGGEYTIKFHPVQWLNNEKPTAAPKISDADLIKGYARAWENNDIDFMRDYLSPYFNADSDIAFDVVTSKSEYLDHFKYLQEKWQKNGLTVKSHLVTDDKTGEHGVIICVNNKASGFVTIDCKDFRISATHTHKLPVFHTEWHPYIDLYETHGDHHAPFLENDELVGYFRDGIKNSVPIYKVLTDIKLDEDEYKSDVFSLKIGYPIDSIYYYALIAPDKEGKTNQFVSAYPYLPGRAIVVQILDILEWSNKLEATIKCKYEYDGEEFIFHFFATDYFAYKPIYKVGNRIEIALAASSGNAKVASKGFSFEGQKALDFLSKMGKEPEYDENGNVKPVKFSTKKLVAFLVHDEKCPDEAEFQSPTESYHGDICFFNFRWPIRKRLITIDSHTQLKVPLYFRANFDIKTGDPLTGNLWLSGRMAHPGIIDNRTNINGVFATVEFARTANFILDYIKLNGVKTEYELDTIVDIFQQIELFPGYKLFCAKVGTTEEYYYKFYIARPFKFFEKKREPNGGYSCTTEENDHPKGIVPDTSVNTIPNVLDRIGVRFNSSQAIFEALLLHIGEHLLPRKGRYYEYRWYYFSREQLKGNTIIEDSDYSWSDLRPSVYFNSMNSGTITIHYWDESRGLVRELYTFINSEGHIQFQSDATFILIEYQEEESDLLFRDGD